MFANNNLTNDRGNRKKTVKIVLIKLFWLNKHNKKKDYSLVVLKKRIGGYRVKKQLKK